MKSIAVKESQMIRTSFSEDEIKRLQANENVEVVSRTFIQFTVAFKRRLFELKSQGLPVKKILRDAGIDPEVLGETRIKNLNYLVNKMARRANSDVTCSVNKRVTRPVEPKTLNERRLEEQVQELKHQLAYVTQEVEFLKKLQMAYMEAQKQWELKHHQK